MIYVTPERKKWVWQYTVPKGERDVKGMFEDLAKQADAGNWENIDYYHTPNTEFYLLK